MSEKVYILNCHCTFMRLDVNRNFALLYGIMLGDGCLSLYKGRKKFISITGSMVDDVPFFETIIQPVFKSLIHKEIQIKFRKSSRSIDFNFVNHGLFDFISSFGFPVGKKGDRLFIPKMFYDKSLVKYVIRGFFATDGSLVITDNNGTIYPRVEANGISKNLLTEISVFLNARGINCKFYDAKRKASSSYGGERQYRLQMNGKSNLKKFVKEVGFVNPKQIDKLNKYYGCEEN